MDAPASPDSVESLRAQVEEARSGGASPGYLVATLYVFVDRLLDRGEREAAKELHGDLAALVQAHPGDPDVELNGWLAQARVLLDQGDYKRSQWAARHAVRLGRLPGMSHELPHALVALATASEALELQEEARAARAEAANVFEATEQHAHAAPCLVALSYLVPEEERLALLERSERAARRGGYQPAVGWSLEALGRYHRERDAYLPSRRAFERALAHARSTEGGPVSGCLAQLAWLEVVTFRNQEAVGFAEEALAAATTPTERGYALRARAKALGQQHRHREAARDFFVARREFRADRNRHLADICSAGVVAEVVLVGLHLLPRFVFDGSDMSSVEAVKKPWNMLRASAVVLALGVLAAAGWVFAWTQVRAALGGRVLAALALGVGLLPGLLVAMVGFLLLRGELRRLRGERKG